MTGGLEVRHGRRKDAFLAALVGCLLIPSFASAQDGEHAEGVRVYDKWCAPCHNPGVEHPGTLALAAKYAGVKSGVLLEWTDLRPEFTRSFVRTGISVMPFFRKTEISDAELDALAAYLARNTPGAGD